MTKPLEEKLDKIPVVNVLVRFFKRIKLLGLEGLSFYDLLELYITGIVKGALTTRASAIAFSFFMALFPFLLFVLIVIPYVPIDDFKIEFLRFLESFLPPSTSEFFFKNIFEGIDNSQRGGLLSSVFVLSIALMANGVNALFSGF
jgi:membrane protein